MKTQKPISDGNILEIKLSPSNPIEECIIDANTKTLVISGVCEGWSLTCFFNENDSIANVTTLNLKNCKVTDSEFGFVSSFKKLRTIIFPEFQEKISTIFVKKLNIVYPANLEKLKLYIEPKFSAKELILPQCLKELSFNIFDYNKKLKKIKIGKNLSKIHCFDIPNNLESVEIDPENPFLTFSDNAIYTKDLKTLIAYIPLEENDEYVVREGTETIQEYAFADKEIKKIILPNTLKNIEESAFYYSRKLEYVSMADSVLQVGDYAFSHCKNLKYLKLSNSISKLGEGILEECLNIEELYLPENLKTIDPNFFAFTDCETEAKIYLPTTNTNFQIVDGIIYSKNFDTLIAAIDKTRKRYNIAKNVKIIERYAFSGCRYLEFVHLPESVTEINSFAFSYCYNLKKIVIGKNLKKFANDAFSWSENLKYVVLKTENPPQIEHSDDGYYSFETTQFVVPSKSKAKYKKADFWSGVKYYDDCIKQCCCNCNDTNSFTDEEITKYRKEAEDGDEYSQLSLSIIYKHQNDTEKSVYWLKKSAEQGYSVAMYNLSHYYDSKGQYDEKVKLLKQIRRIKIDPNETFWLDKENYETYYRATNDLGVCYYYGEGVRKNYKKAFQLYCKAAKVGVAEAICNRGVCYDYGRGTKKNPSKAFCCYLHAALKGYSEAMNNVALCYIEGTAVDKNKDKFMYWIGKALKKNSCNAQNNIAYEYLTGEFLEKDLKKAKKYFLLSINNPDGGDKNRLDTIESARNGNKLDMEMLKLCGIKYM
ncbi:MAG: leucine-rich repeat protein [Bacteroidales bacterium]|nr:leucine-rich repeat protein [Bacteroidales bacterium]